MKSRKIGGRQTSFNHADMLFQSAFYNMFILDYEVWTIEWWVAAKLSL